MLFRSFHTQAQAHGVPFHILDFEVAIATLRDRIAKRGQVGRDASEAGLDILEHQIKTEEPITADEQRYTTSIHSTLKLRT